MTVLGLHTVAETRDLLLATDFRVKQNANQLAMLIHAWPNPPSASQAKLVSDFNVFLARWIPLRDKITSLLSDIMLNNILLSASIVPSERQYVELDNGTRRDNPRLGDLQMQIDAASAIAGLPQIDLSHTPAQDSSDADFTALQKLDGTIKAGENAAAAARDAASRAVTSRTGLLVLGGIGIGIAGIVAVKVYL